MATATAIVVPTPSPSTLIFTDSKWNQPSEYQGLLVPFEISVGQSVNLSNVYVQSSIQGEVITGRVDWGEGDGFNPVGISSTTGEFFANHIYLSAGTYTITVRARGESKSQEDVEVLVEVVP
jgi:hypothetical protein